MACGLLIAFVVLLALPASAQASGIMLRIGSRGPAVVVLQRDLHIRADGAFGRLTRLAVINFQRRHHLAADGVVGARTWRALGGEPRLKPAGHRPRKAPKRFQHKTSPRRAHPAPHRRPVAAPPTLGSRAVALAAAQRGKPYVWGAAGPNSFDCSGLVQWVYRRLGVGLPRTTWAQAAALPHVPRSALRPGDLIFVDGLNHVGIYAGFGVMWHAPHTGSTVRLSLVWDRSFVAARVR